MENQEPQVSPEPKKKKAKEQQQLNIKNLPQIQKMWDNQQLGNKKNPQLYTTLKVKLAQLVQEKKAHPEEASLFWEILEAELMEGVIASPYTYMLNAHLAERCTKKCRVKDGVFIPRGHHMPAGSVMVYEKIRTPPDKFKKTIKFVVYPVHTIPGKFQLPIEMQERIVAGAQVDPKDYPPAKKQVHRKILSEAEFEKWCEPVSDETSLDSDLLDLVSEELPEEEVTLEL